MKKNLTVGMPLAVPTQKRPPGKYVSHPYPLYLEDITNLECDISGEGELKLILQRNTTVDNFSLSAEISGEGELRTPLISYTYIGSEPDAYLVDASERLTLSANISGDGELRGLIINNIAIDNCMLSANISGAGSLVLLKIKHRETDYYSLSASISGTGKLT